MLLYQLNPNGMSYRVSGTDESDTSIVIPRDRDTASFAFYRYNLVDRSVELPSNCVTLG